MRRNLEKLHNACVKRGHGNVTENLNLRKLYHSFRRTANVELLVSLPPKYTKLCRKYAANYIASDSFNYK